MTAVAMLSLHTSPLAQPGEGDSGGMNVYVRELAASLAQAGVPTSVYVRNWREGLPDRVSVEPLFEVVHVPVGPVSLSKEQLPAVADEFADWVAADIVRRGEATVLHANYWLSAVAAHRLKHELELPLVTTFHTLAAVKSSGGDAEPGSRAEAERVVIGCSDAVCASNTVEAQQLVDLYGADASRIEIVPPGVDHAFFAPGNRRGARFALGLGPEPVLLFVGRIQPLKGLDVAVEALARMRTRTATLVAVGGPSGREGAEELARVKRIIEAAGLGDRVRLVPPQPHHLLSTYYRAADLCLVPSRSESFGLVAAEASACGTPVVATAVGGLTTLVDHGSSGLLMPDRNPVAWAAAIDDLLEHPLRLAEMSVAAAERGRHYTWSTTAARLRRVYADLSAERVPATCGVV